MAWRSAVDAADRRHYRKRETAEPTDVLREVLIRAGAWGASTSNVERLFGLLKHRQPKERHRMDERYVRDELFLLTVMGVTTGPRAVGAGRGPSVD